MKILIIEDEFSIADVIKDRLETEGYEVELALEGGTGEYLALTGTYDLVILDGMLPEIDGIDILKNMRRHNIVCPVLMLTARDTLSDKLNGLESGADDYMTKPFEMEELVARVNAQFRRNVGSWNNGMFCGDITIDKNAGQLCCKTTGKKVSISTKELMLMEYLVINKKQTLTKIQISERIWGNNEDVDYNNAEVYVSFLRKKLKHLGTSVNIRTVRGIGYCLEEK